MIFVLINNEYVINIPKGNEQFKSILEPNFLTVTLSSIPDITNSMTPTSPTPTPSPVRLCLFLVLCPHVVLLLLLALHTADGGAVEDRFQVWLNTRKY